MEASVQEMGTVKWYNAEIGHQNFRKLQVADAIEKARAKRAEHDLRGDMKCSGTMKVMLLLLARRL